VFDRAGQAIREFGRRWFGLSSSLRTPRDVLVTPGGEIFVADFGNGVVRVFDRAGAVLREISGRGGPGALEAPIQLAWSSSAAELYVSDTRRHAIAVFGADGGFRRVIGSPGAGLGQLNAPHGVALAPSGLVYVADHGNDRIHVFDATGRPLRTLGRAGSGQGELLKPTDVTVAPGGLIYVVDSGNHQVQQTTLRPASACANARASARSSGHPRARRLRRPVSGPGFLEGLAADFDRPAASRHHVADCVGRVLVRDRCPALQALGRI
jgi:DNA-binding beta-propeller fold protein YncE